MNSSSLVSVHSKETALLKMTSDLLMTADTCFLTIVVLLDLSVALMRFLALSFRRDLHPLHPPSLFHHISLRYHTKFMFCFCWGAPGFRSGASFIHCLHASTRSRFRNTVLAFTVTRMTLRCIFFTLPRISLCDCLMEVIAWFFSHIYPK